jgi:hypothetical protein
VLSIKLKNIYWRWLYFKANYQQSSAKKVTDIIKQRGVSIAKVTTKDLSFIYKKIKPWRSSATYEGKRVISNIFKNSKNLATLDDDCLGVIVETRSHPALEFVVCDFIKQTGNKVQLFHGIENIDFILNSNIGRLVTQNKVILVMLEIEALNANYYNSLFLTEKFWELIVGRKKILVFQTDSVICHNSKYSLQEFLQFDYIGAWWHDRLLPNGLIVDGGVGGFSIRDYDLSIESVRRFSNHTWQGGEDDFFAFHIELLGGKVGKKSDCIKFCTQNEFLSESYSAHQVNNLNPEALEKFLRYCPDAEKIL